MKPSMCVCSQVGYETINNSEDKILKQDMPPALNRVEEASVLLLQASQMLRQDPYSAPARKKLIEGSRGTLNVHVFYPVVRSTRRPGIHRRAYVRHARCAYMAYARTSIRTETVSL